MIQERGGEPASPRAANPAEGVLIVQSGTWLCAIPLREVRETMRCLPVRPVLGSLPFVSGLSRVRGALIPVIDLTALLGTPRTCEPRFFVTVQFGAQMAALQADAVIGTRHIPTEELEPLPSLLSETLPAFIEKLGALGAQNLAFCSAVKLLSQLSQASETFALDQERR